MRTLSLLLLLAGCGSGPSPQADPPAPAEPPRALPSQDPSVPFPAWKLPASAAEPPPARLPRTLAELEATDEGGSRCPEKLRTSLVVFDGDRRVLARDIDEAVALPGSIEVDSGRHQGQRGLPLAAVLEEAELLEVWPCRGEPLRYPAKELRAEPGRYVLVSSGKGTFKLLDTRREGPKPVAKNLAALRRVEPAP